MNFDTITVVPNTLETQRQTERWYQKISVEPTMFLYMMAFMLTSVVEQSFFVYKACTVNHNYTADICLEIEHYKDIKKEVQITTSNFHQWNNIAGHIIPILLAFFLGSFSDRRGRKLPLIIGLSGKFIYSLMIVVNTLMPHWSVEMIIYTATIPSAFSGADVAIFACAFAYISDVTTVEDRTMRITILDVVYLSTMPTGVALGAYLYNLFNKSFTIMFAINASLLLLAVIYSILNLNWRTTEKQRPLSDLKWYKWLGDYFDIEHLKTSFGTLFKKRVENRQLFLLIFMASMAFYTFQRDEKPFVYLYTQLKFKWNLDIYSYFKTYQSTTFVVMMLLGVPVMSKMLKFPDTVIVMIGATSHALGRVAFGLAQNGWVMYLGATIASLGPTVAPVLRSMTSKVVPISERGTVFALLSVCDNAVPLFSSILYTQLYNHTIDSHPAAIFWLTLFTQVLVFSLMMGVHFALKGNSMQPPVEKSNVLIREPTEETTDIEK